jgi:hypothetical protein
MVAGQIIPGFVSTNVGANPGNISGLLLAPDGKLYYNTALGNTQIGTWANGDRIKFAIENRVFVGYQNGVRLVGVPATVAPASTMYFQVHGSDSTNAAISSAIVVPGSAGGAPINIPRFTSNVVYPQPTLMQDAVDGVLKRSPGVEKQDVNGALKMLTDMTRAEAFFFKYDPDTSVVSNIVQAGVKMTRIDPENRTNFYRAVIRDTQDMFLKQVPVFVDRDQLRSDVGGTLRDSGLLQFGVMNQSEGQRILSAQARLLSDLPVFATISSFFQSYVAAIGDYVNVSDDTPGYDLLTPVLFLVTEENVVTDTVPVRAFSLQVITKDWYQDTDHGPAVPLIPPIDNTFRRPAPLVQTIALGESARQLADGSWTYALTGDVTFTPYDGQRARVWRRHPTTEIRAVVMNPATDIFSNAFNNFVNGDQVVFLAGDDALPAENSLNVVGTVLYVVNATSSGFQVSATLAGSPLGFVGTFRIRAHVLSDWEGPGITLVPDIAQHAVFEIVPAQLGQHFVKAVTENRIGASFPFDSHPQFISEIVVQQINPNPPMNMRSTFDGTRIRWTWDPSTTKDVTSYRVTDEFDRLIAITFVPEYSEVRTTEPIITRRVYAVTNIGAVSSLFATFSFVLPFRFAWTDLHETVSQDDHTLKVISATGTYRGATLSTALIMQPVQNRVYVAPHKNNVSQGIALDVGRTWFPDAFYIAVYFNADGTFGTVPGNSSFGSYVVGEEYVIDITPGTTCKLYRRKTVGHTIIETVVHDYGVDPSTGGASHMYVRGFTSAGIGTVIDLLPLLVGNLADNIQTIVPTAQNLVNASYNSTTGNAARTGGTGWGSSGLSIDGIPADQAGGFYFQATGGLGITGGQGTTVGLSNTDPDQNTTSMPFRVVCNDDGSLDTYNNNTLLDHNPTPSAGGVSGLLGVESIFIGRTQHGNLFVSVDDAPIFTWLSTPTSLKNNALVLDIAFNGSIGTHWTVNSIVVIKPFTTQLTPAGNVPQLAMQLVENAHIGENPVYNIPPFAITSPLTGQYLTFDASGNVINTTAPSITADPAWTAKGDLLAGTGAGAAAIRTVGANNLVLTADSSLSTGIKWANPLTVGRAVSGGAANRVAYLDGSQNFATSANLLFDGNKLTVGVAAIIDSPASGDIFIGAAHGGGYTGFFTTAIGVGAGAAITAGRFNVAIGNSAMAGVVTGDGNIAIGYSAGANVTSGGANVLIGLQAAPVLTTGNYNIAIGYLAAGALTTADSTVAIGLQAAGSLTSGSSCVAIGSSAMSLNSTGSSNTYIGVPTGQYLLGSYNTAVGGNAGQGTAGSTATELCTFGYISFFSISSGANNSGFGTWAGFSTTTGGQNTFIGSNAGFSNVSGSASVFIGYQAGYSETNSNRLYISNSNTTTPLIYGEFNNQVLYFTGREIRQRYDASNYLKTTIGATGGVTFDSVGSGAGFTFNNPTTFNSDINLGSNDINSINDLFAATLSAGTLRCIGFTSSAGNPTTTQLTTNKDFGIHRNTSSGDVFLAYNDSGTIKKVLLT